MILYGASGHAKVIISCIRANNLGVSSIFDDDLTKKQLWGIPVIGSYNALIAADQELIIAIGYNNIRKKVAATVQHPFGSIIHPSAMVDQSVLVGVGSVVFHQAIIQADTAIGNHVIVNSSASIDHDCRIADFVHIAPNATLCGNVHIGEGTLIGAGSIVAPNLRIGANCLVAAGSVVTRSLPDNAVVRGNPARIIKR